MRFDNSSWRPRRQKQAPCGDRFIECARKSRRAPQVRPRTAKSSGRPGLGRPITPHRRNLFEPVVLQIMGDGQALAFSSFLGGLCGHRVVNDAWKTLHSPRPARTSLERTASADTLRRRSPGNPGGLALGPHDVLVRVGDPAVVSGVTSRPRGAGNFATSSPAGAPAAIVPSRRRR
jgi:hypothetical protein